MRRMLSIKMPSPHAYAADSWMYKCPDKNLRVARLQRAGGGDLPLLEYLGNPALRQSRSIRLSCVALAFWESLATQGSAQH